MTTTKLNKCIEKENKLFVRIEAIKNAILVEKSEAKLEQLNWLLPRLEKELNLVIRDIRIIKKHLVA